MTKLANSFDLLLHHFFAIMHVNLEAKVLPKAASKGDRRLPYLNVSVVFFFSPPSTHTAFAFFALKITSVPFFLLFGTELKILIR